MLILDRFANALFFNDMNPTRAFDLFDINHDGIITKNEFIYGI